uniref:Inositol 1,4,5-triphosphate receptor associated 2 n=1 Tax=Sciurus vulgaris TaxID=55149 RepID=A0A8D2JIE2_SCIVU
MTSAKKVTEKRHNPVESICRKIKAIQKGEAISNPVRQIIKYQSSCFDSPQTNAKKNFEEVLRKMTATHIPVQDSHFSSSEKVATFISSPETASPRTPSISDLHSPKNATYTVGLTGSEDIARLRSQNSQCDTSLLSQVGPGEFFSSKDLSNYCSGNNSCTLTLGFDSTSTQSSKFFTQDSVVRKLSLNDDGWKLGADDGQDVTYSTTSDWEEQLLTGIFHACDTKCRGKLKTICSVGVSKIIDYLQQTTSQDSEDMSLEELWSMLDPEKRDPQVDLETFHAIMKEWMALGGVKSRLSIMDDSVFEQQGSTNSDTTDSIPGSFEGLGGGLSSGILEMSDFITYVADLHFNKQKLEVENQRFKLALETLEEANSQLADDCTELRLQIKSAHQAVMRTSLLKEELEELKISMSASEEQKTLILAQKKQLETENQALILKIKILQEENIKNIMDIDRLEKKIEELSKAETEHQVSTSQILVKYFLLSNQYYSMRVYVTQRHNNLNGIQLNVSGEYNGVVSEGEKSLHYELSLAHSAENNDTERQYSVTSLLSLDTVIDQDMLLFLREAEQKGVEFTAALQKLHEEVSEVGALLHSFQLWVTNPEITVKEKWGKQLAEFKHIMEEKLNLCILMLKSLRNHKEPLDKVFVKLIETLKKFRLDYFYFRKEFLSSQKQLETIKQLQEDAVNQEVILRQKLQEVCFSSKRLEKAEEQVKAPDQAAYSASEKTKSLLHKLEEAISEQRNLQTINSELSNTCQKLEEKTRKLKILHPSIHFAIFLLQRCLDEEFSRDDPLSCTEKIQPSLQEKLRCYHKPLSGQEARIHTPLTLKHTCWYMPLLDALYLDSLTVIPRPQLTSSSCIASPTHASSERPKYGEIKDGALDVKRQHNIVLLEMAAVESLNLCICVFSLQENGVEHLGSEDLPQSRKYLTLPSPGHTSSSESTVTSSDSGSENLNMASGGLDCKSLCGKEEERSVSSMTEIQGKLGSRVAEFLRLSLGFKCDWFTLEKRVKLEERSRDPGRRQFEERNQLTSLTPLCEDDNQAQEVIKKLENSITFLSQCANRVASRAEMLGAINQESRVSKAVEVMIQHVENLKRMYAKEHAELEELKQVLLQNERSFNTLEDEDDCQIKKRSASLNSKPSSLRRVTIASLPRNIGNAAMVAGMENNDRFSRRSSSWRILGSKQSEHRPSLHRFISTYSWADAEDEKCELKAKDDSEPPEEEIVERTRKTSLSEKKNNPSKWDVSSFYDTIASWATNLKTSIRKANKAFWLSVVFIVLFAALMSFLTGQFFQKSVDAAPTQEGDSWLSLEHILWPFTSLCHNGPPPV